MCNLLLEFYLLLSLRMLSIVSSTIFVSFIYENNFRAKFSSMPLNLLRSSLTHIWLILIGSTFLGDFFSVFLTEEWSLRLCELDESSRFLCFNTSTYLLIVSVISFLTVWFPLSKSSMTAASTYLILPCMNAVSFLVGTDFRAMYSLTAEWPHSRTYFVILSSSSELKIWARI